jgi:hypothetical protein
VEYVKALWSAATMWSTGGYDTLKSSIVISAQPSMVVCLDTCGDRPRLGDPHIASTNAMLEIYCLENGQVWPSFVPYWQHCLFDSAKEAIVLLTDRGVTSANSIDAADQDRLG